MRLGISDHLGWAIAVTASGDHEVVERRRIELIEPGITAAPLHNESSRLDVAGTVALVAKVRASVVVNQAARMLAECAHEILKGARVTLGSPWTKDHRIALAATVVAG